MRGNFKHYPAGGKNINHRDSESTEIDRYNALDS